MPTYLVAEWIKVMFIASPLLNFRKVVAGVHVTVEIMLLRTQKATPGT